MPKERNPMRIFTPQWHETGCRMNKEVKAYWAFWEAHEAQLPTAYRSRGLGWHDDEVEEIRFVAVHGMREDLHITLSYRSVDVFHCDTLVFENIQMKKHNVEVGNIWLFDEVELLPDGRYYIRIMFYAGGDKRRYIKLICDDVVLKDIKSAPER